MFAIRPGIRPCLSGPAASPPGRPFRPVTFTSPFTDRRSELRRLKLSRLLLSDTAVVPVSRQVSVRLTGCQAGLVTTIGAFVYV